jgi:hypothetical protein
MHPTGPTKYSIIFNASDGNYYLDTWRANRNFSGPGQLRKLKYHEKRRIDCYIFLSAFVEKKFGPAGSFYCNASYFKGFSTLDEHDPVGVLNYLWGVSAGWKKEIMLVGK